MGRHALNMCRLLSIVAVLWLGQSLLAYGIDVRQLPDHREPSDQTNSSAKEPKDSKDTKDTKDSKDTKDTKDTKDSKETKDSKDLKDSKDPKDAKDAKDTKDTKDSKDSKDTKDTVEGKILTVEQDAYVVREDSGKTVRLYFDKDTNRPTHLGVGDKILAQVNPLISVAYAMTITKRSPISTGPRVSINPLSGELLKMEGQSYLIKEGSGREIRLFVDDTILNDLRLSVGDLIVAQVINIDGKPTKYVVAIKKRSPAP